MLFVPRVLLVIICYLTMCFILDLQLRIVFCCVLLVLFLYFNNTE
jgi:hypothetical protein